MHGVRRTFAADPLVDADFNDLVPSCADVGLHGTGEDLLPEFCHLFHGDVI